MNYKIIEKDLNKVNINGAGNNGLSPLFELLFLR